MCYLTMEKIAALTLMMLFLAKTVSGNVVQLHGAGATFPSSVYFSWIPAYRQFRSAHVNLNMTYEAIGSGGGQARIKGEQLPPVDYAGSDSMLSEDDYRVHPDLKMFPVMAGAIVMVYNINGVTSLNLTVNQIVGIYNGSITRWSDQSLQEVNPGITLPDAEITTVARQDKSGSTNTFTNFLSLADSNWNRTYGTFSKGLESNNQPLHWNASAIDFFGYTHIGVIGAIGSFSNVLGYLSLSDAKSADLSYAFILSSEGKPLDATVETVQNAVVEISGAEQTALPVGHASYPIISFSYFIIRMSTLSNCNTNMELFRYIEWLYTSTLAQNDCKALYMVPIDQRLYSHIIHDVLQKITCGGKNVYKMVQEQKLLEQEEGAELWQVAVIVVSGVLALLIALISFLLFKRHNVHLKRLIRQPWKIPQSNVDFTEEKLATTRRSFESKIGNSQKNESTAGIGESTIYQPAVLCDCIVACFENKTLCCQFRPNLNVKTTIINYIENVEHDNVLRFMGILEIGPSLFSVYENKTRGTLMEVLNSTRFQVTIEAKLSASYEIISGMEYLHRKNIIHGHLTSACCLIDFDWKVKVAHWDETGLEGCKLHGQISYQYNKRDSDASVKKLFWIAPEIIKFKRRPTFQSDGYSFGMVMQQLFSNAEPYSDSLRTMRPHDIIHGIMFCFLRPNFSCETPEVSRKIMDRLWDLDPSTRPSFKDMRQIFDKCFPNSNSLIDCMIKSLELFAYQLEEEIETLKGRDKFLSSTVCGACHKAVPSEVFPKAAKGHEPDNCWETLSSVSVVLVQIDEFGKTDLLTSITEFTTLLNNIYKALADFCQASNCRLMEVFGDIAMLTSGVVKKTAKNAEFACAAALLITKGIEGMVNKGDLEQRPISVKIGIGTGQAFIMPSRSGHKSFELVGDAVSSAWMMLKTSQPGAIHVCYLTKEQVSSSKEFTVSTPEHRPGYWLLSGATIDGVFEIPKDNDNIP